MALDCPQCLAPMQPLYADLAGKAGVELDRCPSCEGMWFDHGELERVTGRTGGLVPFDGASTIRECPRCRVRLAPCFLGRATPVEVCGDCRGLWLDAEDVHESGAGAGLKRRVRVKPPAPAPPRERGGGPERGAVTPVGFDCAGCGTRTPWSEATGTARGLVCRPCAPQVQPIPRVPTIEIDTRPGVVKAAEMVSLLASWWS